MQFRGLRKPSAAILILSMMIPLTISISTQPTLGIKPPIDPGLVIDTVGLILSETRATAEDRGDFTKRIIERVNREFPNYNAVITFHKKSIAKGPAVIGVPIRTDWGNFYIYLSPHGQPFEFKLNGDGGYQNWAYGGFFDRNDVDGPLLIAK
jgi:hypothetical protein